MEITEVNISLRDEAKLKAFASITMDNCMVCRGLRVIDGSNGYFVSMPSKRRMNGTYQDIVHPINNETRLLIESRVLGAFETALTNAKNAAIFEYEDLRDRFEDE